ncbi:MAG: SdpA family antimicrobial peptide system protein [Bacteroidota bacterium]
MKLKYLFTLIGVIVFWSIAMYASITSNMPKNPLTANKKKKEIVKAMLPQGWVFFTRSSREDQIYVYKITDGKLIEEDYRNASKVSWFGLNRKMRAKGAEIGDLCDRLTSHEWYECEDDFRYSHKWDTIAAQNILNPAYDSNLCGEYLIVQKPIVPWAWSDSKQEIHMPSKAIKINAVCLN